MLDSDQEPSYNLSTNLLLLPRILKLIEDMVDDSTALIIRKKKVYNIFWRQFLDIQYGENFNRLVWEFNRLGWDFSRLGWNLTSTAGILTDSVWILKGSAWILTNTAGILPGMAGILTD